MSKITYSVEILYHLNCHNCSGSYWSLSDKLPTRVTCTHCGFQAEPEPLKAETVKVDSNRSLIKLLHHIKYKELTKNESRTLSRALTAILHSGVATEMTIEEFMEALNKPFYRGKLNHIYSLGERGFVELGEYFRKRDSHGPNGA